MAACSMPADAGPRPDRYQVLAAIMLCGIMAPIDGSIVNIILPTVSAALSAPMEAVQWVPMVYLLTITSLLLLFGRLGDIVGYRRIYLTGLGAFVAASVLCGLAPSLEWLIAARAVQGVAAAMIMAVPFAIVTAVFPPAERGKAMGINAISISAGLMLGPSLGGFIAALADWRYAFLINVPVGLAGLIWGSRIIPDLRGRPGTLDYRGAVTAFLALSSLLYLANQAPTAGLQPATVIAAIVALAAGAAFFWTERRAACPMLDLTLFANRAFSLASAAALLNFMAQFTVAFLTPFYLQRVLALDAGAVGLTMTASPLAVIIVAPFSGALSDRLGTRPLAVAGASIIALGLLSMSALPVQAGPMDVAWRLLVMGLGIGLFQSPNNSAVMGSAPRPQLGSASGVLATMRNAGMVLGIATAGAVLYGSVAPDVVRQMALTGPAAQEYLAGLSRAYTAGAVLAAGAALASLPGRPTAPTRQP